MGLALKHIAVKCCLLLIALQILNLGINSIDFQPFNTTAIGDFNYMNSMSEYVSEIIMGHKDAFPEYQKHPSSSKSQFAKHFSNKLFELGGFKIAITTSPYNRTFVQSLNEYFTSNFFYEINPPPPKC